MVFLFYFYKELERVSMILYFFILFFLFLGIICSFVIGFSVISNISTSYFTVILFGITIFIVFYYRIKDRERFQEIKNLKRLKKYLSDIGSSFYLLGGLDNLIDYKDEQKKINNDVKNTPEYQIGFLECVNMVEKFMESKKNDRIYKEVQ